MVAIAAGGGVDAIGRLVAEKLQERLKQPVVVENRVGAGGAVGADSVAKAAPDGRTLLLIETSSVLHKWLHKNVPFDVVADFAPVSRVASTSLLLFAHPSFPPNTPLEVIAYAKANPGKVSVGTPGVGTPHHLAMLMMNAAAKLDITHVPYRGTGPALNDLLGGQLPMIWATPVAVMPHVASGKVKVIGTASAQRETSLPQVPTMEESGLPAFRAADLFRRRRPGEDAGRDRRAARPRDQGDRRYAGGAGADGESRLRSRLCGQCHVPPADRRRLQALRRHHPRRRHRAELIASVAGHFGRARKVMRTGLWPILAAARCAEKPAAASLATISASA